MMIRLLSIFLLSLLAAPASALDLSERILSFDSRVTVNDDASLTVREDIRVHCLGEQIRHGIYRDFPVVYSGGWFTNRTVGFEVVQVLRDGRAEDYHIEAEGNSKRVYIGNPAVLIKPGDYLFTLVYRTDRQLGFFADHDELYWNVTGNFWLFSIDCATCTVTLPKDVPRDRLKLDAYTGYPGAKGKDFHAGLAATGEAVFRTTRKLDRTEGLTVVIGWPKGFVQPPSRASTLRGFIADNAVVAVTVIGFVAVLAYFLLAWFLVGRDPKGGVIIPLFEPPEGISPPAARYVYRMGFDNVCFSTSILDAAVRGHLAISEESGVYTLTRRSAHRPSPLPGEEQGVCDRLFRDGGSIVLQNENHASYEEARKGLKGTLSAAYNHKLFETHLGWYVPGLVLSALTFVAAGLAPMSSGDASKTGGFFFMCVWLSIWSLGVYGLAVMVAAAWKGVSRHALVKSIGALGITAFAIPFFAGEVVGIGFLIAMSSVLMLPAVAGLVGLTVLFHFLIKAPSVEGREVMDRIDGFRMYLATAEADMLNTGRPPEKTPELFERYLPYAVALGVANEWAEKFTDVLARAGQTPSDGSGWYTGSSSWSAVGAGGFASAISAGFASSLSAASTAPGSSSGSDGGGSSGGGGGGGGGGGW